MLFAFPVFLHEALRVVRNMSLDFNINEGK